MGVYRWYLLFSLIVFSSISHAADCPAGIKLPGATYDKYYRIPIPDSNGLFNYFVNIGGCEYQATGSATTWGDDYLASQSFESTGKPAKSGSVPVGSSEDKPDSGDTGDTGGGSTEPSNPGITPPVNPPVKPPFINPDSNAISQLHEQFIECGRRLNSIPFADYDDYDPSIDYKFNTLARQCNAIYDRFTSLIKPDEINAGSDDNHNFFTGDGNGHFYICSRNPLSPQGWADKGFLYPGPVTGTSANKYREREIGYNCHIVHDSSDGKDKNHCSVHLNFNYTKDDGKGTSFCNSVYSSSLNQGESGGSGGGSHEGSCPAGQFNIPGQGCMTIQCPAGSHPVAGATSSDAPTCETDTGSSGGDTGSGDDSGPGLSTPSLDVPDLTLAPLWNIWPSARDFKLTLPAAQCPVFNIEVFGTTHKIDTFCTLFTPDIIAIIRAICILTASIISFVIVLRS